ncbi:PGF-CTERM sorting domain-containing protein [Natronomonas marina]|jgi:PGF-CTERM protein|uniref:PGF-CTERM sorting domain-containing protein n=1 Tax=Natronomonas marina TaxID=2961939 RepID=UPI0020C9A833|nr:PGF-CTERM sorting domain-containing protein [Natronomonas marina]
MIPRQARSTLTAALVVAGAVAAVVLGAAVTPVAADEHTKAEAEDFTEEANFTVTLPMRTDHYPGNHPVHSGQNGYNASIEYNAVGAQALREVGAEEGAFIDNIILEADWIDYSNCDVTQNTKVFGLDYGNNDSGTQIDEDLIQSRKSSTLAEGGLTIDFYDWGDLGGDPPYAAPEDAIVAAQGAGSNDGPCLKMTSEPGWYQIQGFINGTEADNGPDQEPSEEANKAGILADSNYIYICECDSEAAARETLGPPPNEAGSGGESGGATPTPTPSGNGATPTPTESGATPTPTATQVPDTSTPTATQAPSTPTQTRVRATGTDESAPGGGGSQATRTRGNVGGDGAGGAVRNTPTISEAPGFTPVVALVALLAVALLVVRRR